MTFRPRLAILVLVACLPAIAARLAQADPAAQLEAATVATAVASADRAVSASIAREDAAIQGAIDRKVDARLAAALGPVPVRARITRAHGDTTQLAVRPSRVLYAVK